MFNAWRHFVRLMQSLSIIFRKHQLQATPTSIFIIIIIIIIKYSVH